ncbi:MAG: TauD/TfdA family dioxygenase [Novosphingobium sp.]
MPQTLSWNALDPFGAEVFLDLSATLSAEVEAELVTLLHDRGLILARGQSLSMARQQEICALFGPILLRQGENGYMTNELGGPSASELTFHSDAAYTPHPFDALSLHALDVVDDASSTRFVSAEQALDSLPDGLRQRLAGLEQEMIAPHYTEIAGRACDRSNSQAQKRGTMPAINTNPHNGRNCVWVGEMQTARLLGLDWEESRDLLHEVFDHLYAPQNVLEHRWRNGDIIIWDNIALQHARGNVEGVGKRLLQRVIVGVEGVAPHVAAA